MRPDYSRAKIYNALITPILFAGVPRELAIINGTLFTALVLGLHLFYMAILGIIIHIIAAILTKKDPYFFQIIARNIKQKFYYRV